MKPSIKFGLIIGVIGLVLNACVSTAFGICGPIMSLIAGAVSGFLTAQQVKAATKSDGARAGVIAGLVTGALVFVGQLIGAIGALVLIQNTGMNLPFGHVPVPAAGASEQIVYYLGGLGTGACFGVVGIALSALAGAGAAYLSTPQNQLVV